MFSLLSSSTEPLLRVLICLALDELNQHKSEQRGVALIYKRWVNANLKTRLLLGLVGEKVPCR